MDDVGDRGIDTTNNGLGSDGGTSDGINAVCTDLKFRVLVQELTKKIGIVQSIHAQANGFIHFTNHQTCDLAIIVDTNQHPDLPGITIGNGFNDISVIRGFVNGANIGIFTFVRLQNEVLAAGQQGLHDLKMLSFCFRCGNLLHTDGQTKKDTGSAEDCYDRNENSFFHAFASPFLTPKRRGAV